MKVYISGPITGLPIKTARERFAQAFGDLVERGYHPVNPVWVPAPVFCRCPNFTGSGGADSGHEWDCYMRKDLAALVGCEAILMLPGWETSRGARLELHVAVELGLQVWWEIPTPADPVWVGDVNRQMRDRVGEAAALQPARGRAGTLYQHACGRVVAFGGKPPTTGRCRLRPVPCLHETPGPSSWRPLFVGDALPDEVGRPLIDALYDDEQRPETG